MNQENPLSFKMYLSFLVVLIFFFLNRRDEMESVKVQVVQEEEGGLEVSEGNEMIRKVEHVCR